MIYLIKKILKYLPSKKLTAVMLTVVVIVGGVFLWNRWEKNKKDVLVFDRGNNAQDTIKSLTETISRQDSDNDSLPDWEETLWKTDSQNPDTDGDGTLDGEEVKLGRNPVKRGPNDVLETFRPTGGQLGDTNGEKADTLTGALAQTLFSQYIGAKGAGGGVIDDTAKKELVDAVVTQVRNESESKKHSLAEIKTSPDNTVARLNTYGNTLADTILTHTARAKENELIIVGQAVEKKDEKLLEKLPPIESMYRDLIKSLLLIETPSSLAQLHVNVINSYEGILAAMQNMKLVLQDPLNGAMGITQYVNTLKSLQSSIILMGDYFLENKVYFDKGERGYLFFLSKS
mgnify:CR=1 FL=1